MAKKQAQRDAVAREEAVSAGMVKVKGEGKKRRKERQAGQEWGLGEDGGAFRSGVMRVAGGRRGVAKSAAGAARARR
jgi:hypothetical protein